MITGGLTQSGAELNGTGTLTASGPSAFSGGTQSGSGTTIAQGGAAFTAANFGLDGGRTLQLGGTSTATGTSVQISLNAANPNTGLSDAGSGTLTIASGATFNDQTTSSGLRIVTQNQGGTDTGTTATVNNQGTFTKSGSAVTSTISTLFNNSGIVNVQSGTLDLSGGGTDVGASYTGAGTIQFGGGTRTLDAASSITANALFSAGQTTVNGGVGTGLMTITGGTATFNGTVITGGLTQSGAELNGTGTLTASGPSAFSGGTQSGSGTTIAQGGAAFTAANFGLDGGRTLQLGGTSTATGTSVQISLNAANPNTGLSDAGSGTLTIASGATFNDQTTSSGLRIVTQNQGGTDTGATATVNNQGTFTKSGSAVTSTISTLFNNSGIVNVQSGTLDLSGGGTDVGASYTGAGTIQFGGGTRTLDAASSITANALFSAGQTTVNGGVGTGLMTITGGTATFNGTVITGGLTQSGAELNGTGTLTASGPSAFSGGTQSGSGTTIAQGGAAFTAANFGLDGGRTLQLGGTSTATGTSVQISLNAANPNTGLSDAGSGTLTIASGATFNDQTTSSGLRIVTQNQGGTDTGATATVNNQGTFTKSGSAVTSTISTLFNNSGIVNVQSGTLDLSGGGTDVGASYTGAGTIQFGGGTRTLDAASSITANALFSAGQTTVNGGVGTGLMTITGGTATFNGTVITGGLTQSGAELNGTGTLTASGPSAFSGGTQSGSGTTIAQGGAAFTAANFGLDGGRTLQLGGTSTATGTSVQISLNAANPNTGLSDAGSGTLTIASGATFNDQTTSSGLRIVTQNQGGTDTGATATVNNQGTFTKSGSAVTSTISTTFNNSGTVNVTSGALSLTGGGTLSGTFNMSAGATAQFNGATPFILTGIAAFIGGAISGNGSFIIGNGARVEISSSDMGSIGTVPTVAFSTGNGVLTLDNPSTFQSPITGLAIGDTIDLLNTAVQSATIAGSTLTVTETNNQTLTFQVSGAISGNSFSILSDPTGSMLVLVPSTGMSITGAHGAGTLSFAPTSTQLYQLSGAIVSGSGGNGFLVQSNDNNPADSIIAEIDPTSSISASGTNFDGVRITSSGANVFIFDAAPVSAARFGLNAVSSGSGNITIASSNTQITSGSDGIHAPNISTAILASANSTIAISASGSINSGTVLDNGGSPGGIVAGYTGGSLAANLNVNGTVIVTDFANITAAAGDGIRAYNYGNGNVTVNDSSGTTVSGAQYGIAAFAVSGGTGDVAINVSQNATINAGSIYGILGFNSGAGSISITTSSGDIISGPSGSTGSIGIDAVNEAASILASSNSSITVTAYGTINSGSAVTGTGSPPAGIDAGYLGGNVIPTTFPLTAINGDVIVTDFANITAAAGDGIRAYNYGIGDVTVNDEAGAIIALGGASPTNGYGVGIGAYNFGTGNINVSTAAGITIQSGSSGIAAINEAPAALSSSTVLVVAHGTITPGIIPTGNGNPAAGILAGYNFNGSPDDNVAGSLIIDDFASISAPSGTDGIRGFNYGVGDITIIAEATAIISGGRYGIGAVGHDGGDAHINNSATVSGPTAGVFAQTTGTGAISIVNSGTGVIQNSGNFSKSSRINCRRYDGSAVINNFGSIEANQNSAAALAILEVGSSITINNSALIIGDVNLSNAIFNNNVGADWELRGPIRSRRASMSSTMPVPSTVKVLRAPSR